VRLAELIRENRELPVNELLATIPANVQEYSGPTQADDITVIVALCHLCFSILNDHRTC
jgi:serine phosphatase RsbU (regulator of sigma subunit)